MVLVAGASRQLPMRRGRFNGADGDAIRRDNFYSEKEGMVFYFEKEEEDIVVFFFLRGRKA
jgi:hypothetical protein